VLIGKLFKEENYVQKICDAGFVVGRETGKKNIDVSL